MGTPPPPVFLPKKSKLARRIVENKNSSPRALKMSVQSGVTFSGFKIQSAPKPPLLFKYNELPKILLPSSF